MHRYPAKLLLFGEHILLTGAPALAVPVPAFAGHWSWSESMVGKQKRLLEFAQSDTLKFVRGLDVQRFQQDLSQGLFLDSNIPTGYGLGSSGALCAAIYDRYCTEKTTDLDVLKSIFAQMEGFFHGSSSGIDPLTSYLAQPVLIENKTEVQLAVTQSWAEPPTVFLLDSTLPRQTGPLVQWFLGKTHDAVFAEQLHSQLLPAHAAMLQGWLEAKPEQFWAALREVSVFQLGQMPPMIPPTVRGLWTESLDQERFSLKICGAGGGGFVLGFARKKEDVEPLAGEYRVVFPF